MEVELIISGLSQFVNVDNSDDTIIGPSVILVQTDNCGAPDCSAMHDAAPPNGAGGHGNGNGNGHLATAEAIHDEAANAANGNGNGNGHRSHIHIPYIAFNADEVEVNNGTGFSPVPGAPNCRFMVLDGVQMTIEGKPRPLVVDDSYRQYVVQKDNYWPDAKKTNEYNPAYVPKKGADIRPKKTAVKAYLPLNGGTLSAGNLSRCAWAFLDGSEVTLCGQFAEEVLYRDFPHSGQEVEIKLTDLDDGTPVRTLRFTPKKYGDKVTLFLGNHAQADMAASVRREQFEIFDPAVSGTHWVFLNQTVGLPGPGPLPKPLLIPLPGAVPGAGGGLGTGGPCGPGG